MKYLKLLSICLFASFAMGVSAAVTAHAEIKVQGDLSKTPDILKITEDDALTSNFALPNTAVYSTAGGNDFSVSLYAFNGSNKYSAVASKSVEGLQIKFIANAYETEYTMSFSGVSGTPYFLQKGDDAQNLIPMTEDYAITCAVSEVITFTVVKQATPQKDYTRDAATVIGNWYTICVPGGVDATEYAPVMDVYTVAGYDAAEGLAVDPMTGVMQPGVPYIFQAKATLIEFNYNGEDEAFGPKGGEDYNYLTGTFEDMYTENVAYVVANNKLNWAAAGTTVPANRAFLNVTDITELPVPNPIYPAPGRKFLPAPKTTPTNLEGATVNGLQNGTYMVNGQLVIVKDGKTFNVLGL